MNELSILVRVVRLSLTDKIIIGNKRVGYTATMVLLNDTRASLKVAARRDFSPLE
jgi:hypothetical protein